MWRGELVAYMISTTARRHVRHQTLANLAATDWGTPPVVLVNQGRYRTEKACAADNARSALLCAVARPGDVFVFFEDDLAFNRSIRWNLEHWEPLLAREPDGYFFASLYNPNVGSLSPDLDRPTHRIADPELTYGAQAFVLSIRTARHILEHWDDLRGLHDTRMPRLAARQSPIYYHRPSLVQHLPVPSSWGGVAHSAIDYDEAWRAPA